MADFRLSLGFDPDGKKCLLIGRSFVVNGPSTIYDGNTGEELSLYGGEIITVEKIVSRGGVSRELMVHGEMSDAEEEFTPERDVMLTFDKARLILNGFDELVVEMTDGYGGVRGLKNELYPGKKTRRKEEAPDSPVTQEVSSDPLWGSW